MTVVSNKLSGIESAFTEKGSGRKPRDKRKRRRNVIITTSVLAVTGGVAAVLILNGSNESNQLSSLEVTWE